MKKEIHPELHPVVFVDTSNSVEFPTMSTRVSEETREINGVSYFVIQMEVTSASHPFYTGKQRFVDSAGQVDKFQKRAEKVKEAKEKVSAAGSKKKKRQGKDTGKNTKKAAKAALKQALQD